MRPDSTHLSALQAPLFTTRRVLGLVLLVNLVICAGKLAVGRSVNSLSMVADGFHSLLDAAANVLALAGATFAAKPPNEDHPYGHQKFEVLAALGIAVMMGITCLEILRSAFQRMGEPSNLPAPNAAAFAVIIGTMALNAGSSWFESKKGMELRSSILKADSAHTGSDFLSSTAVLAALAGTRLGWPGLDLAASFLVVVFVGRSTWEIVRNSLHISSDRITVDPARVAEIVTSVPEVLSCHKVRSRGMPGHVFVDLHIQVASRMSTLKSHALTHRVMAAVKDSLPGVIEVIVHTEPFKPTGRSAVKNRR